jgi:hypothetical protein
MTFNYERAAQSAAKLIAKFGGAGSVTKQGVTGEGFDQNGDPIPDSPDITISGTITPLLQFKSSEIDGSAIQMGDSYVFFDSVDAPEIDMQTTVNSVTFRIVDIKSLTSVDDIVVFRRLQLRK